MKEFNLSEKIKTKKSGMPRLDWLYLRDVRRFIKELKEEFGDGLRHGSEYIKERIDKLAGEELIK